MQYGAVEESGPQGSRGLRTLQIWCIVIAVYKLIFGDFNIYFQCAFVKGNNAGNIAIGVIAIILAIGHFFSNILLLVPSCKKEPQAAYGSQKKNHKLLTGAVFWDIPLSLFKLRPLFLPLLTSSSSTSIRNIIWLLINIL